MTNPEIKIYWLKTWDERKLLWHRRPHDDSIALIKHKDHKQVLRSLLEELEEELRLVSKIEPLSGYVAGIQCGKINTLGDQIKKLREALDET